MLRAVSSDVVAMLSSSELTGVRRSALPPGRHVAHTKLAHAIYPRPLGDDSRLARLPGRMPRLVPDGLAVRSDREHFRSRDARIRERRDGGARQPFPEIEIEPAV